MGEVMVQEKVVKGVKKPVPLVRGKHASHFSAGLVHAPAAVPIDTIT
jgi:hypothetical protein